MLIFDNIIFATFIPQILMFLGFMSCVIAPFFSAHHHAEVVFSSEPNLTEHFISIQPEVTAVHFYDFHKVQSETPVLNESGKGFLSEFIIYRYPEICYLFRSADINFAHFSRPPPFYKIA